MEEDGPYFSAVMSSPSDDGQYTDTDKEVESTPASKDNTVEATGKSPEQRTSSHGGELSLDEGLSDGEGETIGISEGERDEPSDSELPRESDPQPPLSGGSLQEDEEVRLRRKLLEKRGVAQPMDSVNDESCSTQEERVAVKEGGTRDNEIDLPMETPSDDEEMFSIQPKDVVKLHKERSRSARLHGERGKDRVEMERFRRREERDRVERHRHKLKKKDKDQERVKERGRDKYKRDSDPKEERSRHSSSKQTGAVREREFGRLAGRVTVPEQRGKMPPSETRGKMPQPDPRGKTSSRSQDDKVRKERVKESDSRAERTAKETLRVRSPRKRDASPPGVKPRFSKGEFPAKRERREQLPKIEVKGPSEEPEVMKEEPKETTEEPKETKEEMKPESIDLDTDDVNDVVKPLEDSEYDEDATPKLEHHDSPSGPSKYSKFDSSPEEVMKEEEDVQDIKPVLLSSASDSEAESDVVMRVPDDELEVMVEEDINEEKLLQLSPDTRARIESEQQRRLIAQLPVFYPGISGCRNVAEFECLNRIEEGTFGVVYRAKEKRSDLVVALKRLKMEKEREGFPITSLREINMLLKAGNHPNIVNVREIVIGSTMDKIYLVMEYVEHDMKSLMDMMHSRGKHFTIGQVKTLLHQLLSGVAHMHDEWILHRDLKTSNLLLSHKGILKIGDFGLAREFGDPLQAYTPIVVTLWYRSPELLLGVKEYSTAVDMWSCGCIFAEFLKLRPLFPGKGELDEINKIFLDLGTPSDKIWPGYSQLPGPRKMKFEYHEFNQLWKKFPTNVVDKKGLDFLNELLRYDPAKRVTAHEALMHDWFDDEPHPTPPELFPTWPAKSELGKAVTKSPITKPPSTAKDLHDQKLYRELKVEPPQKASATGFALKFDAVKFGD